MSDTTSYLMQLILYNQENPFELNKFYSISFDTSKVNLSDEKRKQLFAKVRKGVVRVLLGSTSKMGEGVNVQERVIALHRLDCPWKPSQVEQQIGRGERRGNINEKIFDSTLNHCISYISSFPLFLSINN